jgi:hypothetical protein
LDFFVSNLSLIFSISLPRHKTSFSTEPLFLDTKPRSQHTQKNSDLVFDHVLEVLGDLAALVGLDGLLDLEPQGHGGPAALALARARRDVTEALGAGAHRGLGVEVLEELDEREHDQEVDDEADDDEGDERVDKVAYFILF